MNNLEKKIFITIFSIFTLFLLIVSIFINFQKYNMEYDGIKNSLKRVNTITKPNKLNEPNSDRIIIDYEVYTILFDNDKEIKYIFSHSNIVDSEKIEELAKKIINEEREYGIKINNLYFDEYAYNYTNNNLTIIKTNNVRERLNETLLITFIQFIIFDLISGIISIIITKWLTKPVIDSFNKQKEFIQDASHELKTPVAVIMASADALEKDNNEKWLNNIKEETERMNKLITNLLDLSKIENMNDSKNYKEENISKIINKQVLTFESIAYENNLSIDTNIDKDIILNCDSNQIKELISILLDNAIKHGYKDSHININLKNNKSEIELKVINNGEEIKKEDEEKIFERFYRVDKSRNRSAGRYGLGLAIAKKKVTNHNGKIRAYSKDNLTTFEIIFKK